MPSLQPAPTSNRDEVGGQVSASQHHTELHLTSHHTMIPFVLFCYDRDDALGPVSNNNGTTPWPDEDMQDMHDGDNGTMERHDDEGR